MLPLYNFAFLHKQRALYWPGLHLVIIVISAVSYWVSLSLSGHNNALGFGFTFWTKQKQITQNNQQNNALNVGYLIVLSVCASVER